MIACCDWAVVVLGRPADHTTRARTCDHHEDAAERLAEHDALQELAERSVTIRAAYAFGDWPPEMDVFGDWPPAVTS